MNNISVDAIIVTALPVEYQAVIAHLEEATELVHPAGTIYEVGKFSAENQNWQVAIMQVGMGNPKAAFETERAIHFFKQPAYVFFVGVAGGIKDVILGDVVAATKVYGFEYGKDAEKFKPRTEFGAYAYPLVQRTQMVSKQATWVKRIKTVQPQRLNTNPTAFLGAIAAGEKVVAATDAPSYQLLQASFSDALAVEMEGFGFLSTIHANHKVQALLVRGISDLIDNKSEADAAGSQIEASGNAAAFAFEVIAKLKKESEISTQNTMQPTTGDELTLEEKWLLVNALLKCPSMQTGKSRNTILSGLRNSIFHAIARHDNNRFDVFSIVNTCLNYDGGIAELVAVLNHFDGETIPMFDLKKLLKQQFPKLLTSELE